jgi:hypothetical protein
MLLTSSAFTAPCSCPDSSAVSRKGSLFNVQDEFELKTFWIMMGRIKCGSDAPTGILDAIYEICAQPWAWSGRAIAGPVR